MVTTNGGAGSSEAQRLAAEVVKLVGQAGTICAFTGAGISTESGLSDFIPSKIFSRRYSFRHMRIITGHN